MGEQPAPQRTRLEAVVGTEFSVCNIIAGEASTIAHDRIATAKLRELYVFDDTAAQEPQRLQTWHIERLLVTTDYSNPFNEVELVLAQRKQSRLAREAAPLRLLAIVRDDLAVPVATFGRHKRAECTYVQLGDETTDESYVVTPHDRRKEIVTAIRDCLQQEPNRTVAPLAQFIAEIMATKADDMQSQQMPALCRRVFEYYDRSTARGRGQTVPLRMLLEEAGEPLRQEFQTVPFATPQALLADKRPVELKLARQSQRRFAKLKPHRVDPHIQLLAVVRGNVGLPLVRFSPKGITALHDGEAKLIDNKAVELLRQVAVCTSATVTETFKWQARDIQQRHRPEKLADAIRKAAERGSLREAAIGKAILDICDPDYASLVADVSLGGESDERVHYDLTQIRLERLFVPDAGHIRVGSDYWDNLIQQPLAKSPVRERGSRLLELAVTRHNAAASLRANTELAKLDVQLDITAQFMDKLGEYNPETERLLVKLGQLARRGPTFSGRLKRQRVHGNDDRADVELAASISRIDDRSFEMKLAVVPTGLQDSFEEASVYDKTIDTTAPMPVSPEDIKEALALLNALNLR